MSHAWKHKLRCKNPAVIVGWVILGIIAFAAFFAGFGLLVQWLWNMLMPDIFGLTTITFWQAVGILILFKILFGGFNGKGGNHKWKHKRKKHRHHHDHGKWKYYQDFWEEEGEAALNAYIERKSGENLKTEEE